MTQPHPLPETGSIPFSLDGRAFELPALDTRVWLDAVLYEPPACWHQLLPGQLDLAAYEHLWSRMMSPIEDDPFDLDDLEDMALSVLSRPLGCDFWAGRRLLLSARAEWLQFDGLCVQWGFDPLAAPVHRTVSAIYALRVQQCDEDGKREKLDSEIFAPPDGLRASGRPWSEDAGAAAARDAMESQAFMAWRNQRQG